MGGMGKMDGMSGMDSMHTSNHTASGGGGMQMGGMKMGGMSGMSMGGMDMGADCKPTDFCCGGGMVMIENGFKFFLGQALGRTSTPDCVVLYTVPLTNVELFLGACGFAVLLTTFSEWLVSQRRALVQGRLFTAVQRLARLTAGDAGPVAASGALHDDQKSEVRQIRLLVAFLYGLNMCIGYLIMLLMMTYTLDLWLSVILGLTLGHYLFNVRHLTEGAGSLASPPGSPKASRRGSAARGAADGGYSRLPDVSEEASGSGASASESRVTRTTTADDEKAKD